MESCEKLVFVGQLPRLAPSIALEPFVKTEFLALLVQAQTKDYGESGFPLCLEPQPAA